MKQLFFNFLIREPRPGILGRLSDRFAMKLRSLLLKFADPSVRWQLGTYWCNLPLSHDLPLILRSYPQYCGFIVRVAAFLKEKTSDFSMIDIGANIGDTPMMVRSRIDCPILCIEGNPGYFQFLSANTKAINGITLVGSSRVDLQACKLEYSIVSPK